MIASASFGAAFHKLTSLNQHVAVHCIGYPIICLLVIKKIKHYGDPKEED